MKTQYSFQRIVTGADLAIRRLPMMRADSEVKGPTLWLTACMHGEEVGGIALIQDLFADLQKQGLICGQVCAFPLLNPWGFETMTRTVHPTGEDLNRSFPGNPKGTLAQRMAAKILPAIDGTSPDLVIDLHHDWVRSVPYGLLDPWNAEFDQTAWEKSKSYLKQCDMLQVIDTDVIPSSLTYNLLMKGIPSLTFELGESYRINEPQIRFGLEIIWQLLSHLGMVQPRTDLAKKATEGSKARLLQYAPGPIASEAGIIRYKVLPGDVVRKNQPIACIYNSFGKKLKTLKAQEQAVVLGYRDYAVVFPGMQVMAFGLIGPEL